MNEIRKLRKRMLVGSAIYAAVCIIVSFVFLRFGARFAKFTLGLLIAAAALNINFELLGYFIDMYLGGKNMGLSFVIYAGRLLFYAVLAVICFFIGKTALTGFAVGIVGVTPGIISILVKEAQEDNES